MHMIARNFLPSHADSKKSNLSLSIFPLSLPYPPLSSSSVPRFLFPPRFPSTSFTACLLWICSNSAAVRTRLLDTVWALFSLSSLEICGSSSWKVSKYSIISNEILKTHLMDVKLCSFCHLIKSIQVLLSLHVSTNICWKNTSLYIRYHVFQN